jgi:hypothetical protein
VSDAGPEECIAHRPNVPPLQRRLRLHKTVLDVLRSQIPRHLYVPAACSNPTRKSQLGTDLSMIGFLTSAHGSIHKLISHKTQKTLFWFVRHPSGWAPPPAPHGEVCRCQLLGTQGLPNIYANLLNGIVPIAEPIPLWRVGLCSACHIRRPGGNRYGTRPLNAGDKLPALPAVPLPFAH